MLTDFKLGNWIYVSVLYVVPVRNSFNISPIQLVCFNRKFWIKWQKTSGKRKKVKKKEGCKENVALFLMLIFFKSSTSSRWKYCILFCFSEIQ